MTEQSLTLEAGNKCEAGKTLDVKSKRCRSKRTPGRVPRKACSKTQTRDVKSKRCRGKRTRVARKECSKTQTRDVKSKRCRAKRSPGRKSM
jgi:hypothetical protein